MRNTKKVHNGGRTMHTWCCEYFKIGKVSRSITSLFLLCLVRASTNFGMGPLQTQVFLVSAVTSSALFVSSDHSPHTHPWCTSHPIHRVGAGPEALELTSDAIPGKDISWLQTQTFHAPIFLILRTLSIHASTCSCFVVLLQLNNVLRHQPSEIWYQTYEYHVSPYSRQGTAGAQRHV